MKHFLLGLASAAALAGVVALSRSESASVANAPADPNALQIEPADKNPWTSLKLNNDAEQFSFAVVSDRTGGHRDKIFSRAVQQINLLQPTFVMSVGDLIEGYSLKEDVVKGQWDEFDGYVKKFEAPFFYVPGNHDLTNRGQVATWTERYGKRYYHFVYKNTLFLSLCSESPPDGMGTIDKEQQEWVAKTLAANANVRWTFVFLHKPIWNSRDLEKNGWAAVEKALAGRKYNVFCGHVHRYQVFHRNGTEYYQLATTGGGSRLRGTDYGEFDHIAWITMKKDAPVIANVMLDGILPANLKVPDSEEKGVVVKKVATHPVEGKLHLDGKPFAGAMVTLWRYNENTKRFNAVCNGKSDEDGRFQMSTYRGFDGAPAGEFIVTVTKALAIDDEGMPIKNVLPEAYGTAAMSQLKMTIKEGTNDLTLELKSK
jgi:calcineurin-like phosphoesterase family protein